MPYNNSGYPFRSSAGTGMSQQYQNYGGNAMNTNGYAQNGNPNGAYNQQRQDLGRYRPPTIQSVNNGQSQWNDQGGYEYNVPNSYGGGGNYYNSGQQAQYGREGQRPQFREDYYAQQPQIYQRGQLQGAFQQAQVAARNPNVQRPQQYSDTGGGYGQNNNPRNSFGDPEGTMYAGGSPGAYQPGGFGYNPDRGDVTSYGADGGVTDSRYRQGPQRPRFQGASGWRPNQGIRQGVPANENTGADPIEVGAPLDPYTPDPNRGSAIPKPSPINGARPPATGGFPTGPRFGSSGDPAGTGSVGTGFSGQMGWSGNAPRPMFEGGLGDFGRSVGNGLVNTYNRVRDGINGTVGMSGTFNPAGPMGPAPARPNITDRGGSGGRRGWAPTAWGASQGGSGAGSGGNTASGTSASSGGTGGSGYVVDRMGRVVRARSAN